MPRKRFAGQRQAAVPCSGELEFCRGLRGADCLCGCGATKFASFFRALATTVLRERFTRQNERFCRCIDINGFLRGALAMPARSEALADSILPATVAIAGA